MTPQEDLGQRLQRLEDIEAIKNLKARYCLYCDDNFNVDKIVPLFTPDAEWVATSFGPFKGHDQLRDFWTNITKRLTFAIHYVSNPIIEVRGDTAHATWYLLEPGTIEGKQAIWIMGVYHDDMVKIKGRWLFKRVQLDIHFRTPYDTGWAVQTTP
ncbi:MAG: nuclear transport factor 2 family protein [SAR202 cluster bacterium]|nr:nuclear transport factor 2 family protein [SAR202 cluster bacterium]